MDQFFARLLLAEEGALMLINLGLIVFGGLVGHKILVEGPKMRRATYFFGLSVLSLALSASQIGWTLLEAAAVAGFFSGAIMLLFSTFFLFGLGLYYLCAARSRDITGDRRKAWLGFVPLANLWLLFEPGAKAGRIERSGGFAVGRFIGNTALVILSLFLFIVAKGIEVGLEEQLANADPSRNPVTRSIATQAQTVEEALALEARLSSALLPLRLDEITTLRTVTASGDRLSMDHAVSEAITLRGDFEQMLAADYCGPEMFGDLIARGAVITTTYSGPGETLIASYNIDRSDCS